MAVADRCTVLRKGKGIGTVEIKNTTKEELSKMIVLFFFVNKGISFVCINDSHHMEIMIIWVKLLI